MAADGAGSMEACPTRMMLWWDFLKDAGGKGLEAAAPLWAWNPEPETFTPQGTPAGARHPRF